MTVSTYGVSAGLPTGKGNTIRCYNGSAPALTFSGSNSYTAPIIYTNVDTSITPTSNYFSLNGSTGQITVSAAGLYKLFFSYSYSGWPVGTTSIASGRAILIVNSTQQSILCTRQSSNNAGLNGAGGILGVDGNVDLILSSGDIISFTLGIGWYTTASFTITPRNGISIGNMLTMIYMG